MGASLPTTGSAKRRPEPEINVTPLVDVVLVLLIIFMVIAPAIAEGEQIELPTITQPDPKPKELDWLDVTLTLNGGVMLEEERIAYAQLKPKLEAMYQADPKRKLLLKSDAQLPYKKVRETFAMIQDIGFRGISLKVQKRDEAGKS